MMLNLVGYYGMRNSGDDALMLASAWGIKHILGSNTTKISFSWVSATPLIGAQAANLKPTQRFKWRKSFSTLSLSLLPVNEWSSEEGSVLHSETDINLKRHLMGLTRSNRI